MNVAPVADQRKAQQKECDQQQARRLRRIYGVAVMLVRGLVVSRWGGHGIIVALESRRAEKPAAGGATLRLRGVQQ